MNVLDVMSMQKRIDANNSQKVKPTDYGHTDKPGIVQRFLFECAAKLTMNPTTSSCAAIILHRVLKEIEPSDYDLYLIAISALYLAAKVGDHPVKIRDVINVSHNALNRTSPPLELGDGYWALRDAIVQTELLIARILKFDLNSEQPHKYLLYYMKTLRDWLDPTVWTSVPLAKTAVSFLQDFHHSPKILNHKTQHIAVCCLSLALQTYGVHVRLSSEADDNSMWYTAFVNDLPKEKHWEIIEDIIEVYNRELELN